MMPAAHGWQHGDKVRLVRTPSGHRDSHTPVGEVVGICNDADGVRKYTVRFLNGVAERVPEDHLAPAWTEHS